MRFQEPYWYKHGACDKLTPVSVYVCAEYPQAQIKTLNRGGPNVDGKWAVSWDEGTLSTHPNQKAAIRWMRNWLQTKFQPLIRWAWMNTEGGNLAGPTTYATPEQARIDNPCCYRRPDVILVKLAECRSQS